MTKQGVRAVELPSDLCDAIEARFVSGDGTLEEFLVRTMRELVKDDAAQMDQAEREVVERRLRDLGYL